MYVCIGWGMRRVLFLFVNDLMSVRIFTEFCRKLQHLEFFRTRKRTLVITLNIKRLVSDFSESL